MRNLKPKYKTIFISIGIVLYMLVALSFSGSKAYQQNCIKVKVLVLDSSLNMFISSKDIDKILAQNEINIIGYPVKEINTLELEKLIETHPSIENANVYSTVKGNINVLVEQRKPLLRIMDDNGDGYYIDNQGLLMPLSTNFTTRVPVVTGNIKKYYQKYKNEELTKVGSDTLLQNLFSLGKELKKDKYWSAMCDQIYITREQNIKIIPKIGAHEIILGKNQDYKKDLRILTTFYTEVLPVVGWEKYKSINLQYKQQIVCK